MYSSTAGESEPVGPPCQVICDNLGVPFANGRLVPQAKFLADGLNRRLGWPFDLQEIAQIGQLVEDDLAVGDTPGLAALFEGELLDVAEAVENGGEFGRVVERRLNFLATFNRS